MFFGSLAFAALLIAQTPDDRPLTDALTRLDRQLESGETTLEYQEGAGYLPSLLKHLDVNVDSQTLVFSKTSFQQTLINPKNPRALYFNDHVAVGTVPGGDVYELLALEPREGIVFYSLGSTKTERPRLHRRGGECLFCHALGNNGAASLIVASVIPQADGAPAFTGSFISTIDHRAPFSDRWGGWYVTGTHGSQKHMGNAVAPDPQRPFDLEQAGTQNVTSLDDRFDVTKYLTGSSDIVALMTLEHQVGATNRLTSLAHQYRVEERDRVRGTDLKTMDAAIDDLVSYLMFVDESRLTEPVKGVSKFTETFEQRGPRDSQGRSLRQFDLQTRLFRFPLSYMVYNELFDTLPASVRDRVLHRLYEVLTEDDKDSKKGKYGGIPAADRQAVLEILRETKPNLPDYWKAAPGKS